MSTENNEKNSKSSSVNEDLLTCFVAMCMRKNTAFLQELTALYNCHTGKTLTYDSIKGRVRPINQKARQLLEKVKEQGIFAEEVTIPKGRKRKVDGTEKSPKKLSTTQKAVGSQNHTLEDEGHEPIDGI